MIKLRSIASTAHELAKSASSEIDSLTKLPDDISAPLDQPILPHSLFLNTRGYLQKIVYQINSTYIHSDYDACAVMTRRLIEVLVIETCVANDLKDKITDGDWYLGLKSLIDKLLAEKTLSITPKTRRALTKFREYGDLSAHGHKYNAKRPYIDDITIELRVATEELLYLSKIIK